MTEFTGVEIQSADPQATSARWAAVLGRRADLGAAEAGHALRIARERGLRVSADAIDLCGTRFRLI